MIHTRAQAVGYASEHMPEPQKGRKNQANIAGDFSRL